MSVILDEIILGGPAGNLGLGKLSIPSSGEGGLADGWLAAIVKTMLWYQFVFGFLFLCDIRH